MSIENLILGAYKLSVTYLIRYDSLLQITTVIWQIATVILQIATKYNVYYKCRQYMYY